MVKGIFLDISGAFDTVPHNLLLLKLKAHGINGPLLNLIKSYLENRKVMIKIGNSLSSPTPDNFINLGVPQGSLLGPLFFLIYINDLPENIISKLFIYADDTSLYYPLKHDDIQNGITELQTDLNKISIWAQKWHMEFEPSKCRDITFHSARKRVPIIPSTFLGNKEIPRVQSHKHLGIILDESLNFKEHVNTLIGRYQKMVNPLKALSFKMPSKHLEKIHNTFMIPILDYGDILYQSAPKFNLAALDRVHYRAACNVSGVIHGSSTVKVLRNLNWQTLDSRRKYHMSCYAFKMKPQ